MKNQLRRARRSLRIEDRAIAHEAILDLRSSSSSSSLRDCFVEEIELSIAKIPSLFSGCSPKIIFSEHYPLTRLVFSFQQEIPGLRLWLPIERVMKWPVGVFEDEFGRIARTRAESQGFSGSSAKHVYPMRDIAFASVVIADIDNSFICRRVVYILQMKLQKLIPASEACGIAGPYGAFCPSPKSRACLGL